MISMALYKDTLQISCKDLGVLALESYCPRCVWIKLHVSRLPFQIYPGIFSSIDAYSKKVTKEYFQKHGYPPKWFGGFGDLEMPVKVPTSSKFFVRHRESNIKLTGVPDEIFQKKDGSYFIVDYKTARFTPAQELWMPIYKVQLNGYAYIAERTGLEPVAGLGLAYYEPMTAMSYGDIDENIREKGFSMRFAPNLRPIGLNTGMIEPLLLNARAIYDMPKPPDGQDGCKDCGSIAEIIAHMR